MTMYATVPVGATVHDFAHTADWDLSGEDKGMQDMYRKEDTQAAHGCDAIYCQDLSDDADFFGSVDTANDNEDAFPFPVVDFSSSECATPTPEHSHPAADQSEQYGRGQAIQAASRAGGEAMQALPPSANSRMDKAEVSDINNPYAKPRITFRNGGPSPRAVRPVAQIQVLAPLEGFVSGTHQQHLHTSPAAARPRVKAAGRQVVPNKMAKVCFYELCPSPMQSNKWRTVTEGTAAGGQAWDPLVGKMLCDSCYSTFRKHGTLVRSVRTAEGWARLDNDGTVHRPNHPKAGRAKRLAPSSAPSFSASFSVEGSPKQRKRAAYPDKRAAFHLEVYPQAGGDAEDSYRRQRPMAMHNTSEALVEDDAQSEGCHDDDDDVEGAKEERHDDFCAQVCSSHEQWHSMGADESVAAF